MRSMRIDKILELSLELQVDLYSFDFLRIDEKVRT